MGTGSSELNVAIFVRILYDIHNCGNKSVMFGVNFNNGDRSSYIGGFTFLATPFIYCLFSIWIFKYTLLSITSESRKFFFTIPPGGIAYVNNIFNFIYISFASSFAASSTNPTVAYSAFKLSASASYSSSSI